MNFTDQRAVVTGAASGIGKDIALALHREGARVLFVDRSPAVTEIAEVAGAEGLVADVAAADFPDRVAAWLNGHGLSHLVTAAGIQVRTPGIEIAEEDWARLLDVNLSSFYRTVRGLHGALRTGDGTRPGSVLAMSSMSADRVLAGIVPYGSVKAGLSQLIAGLAVELGEEGIRLNAIAPGYIRTEMTAQMLAVPANHERIVGRTPMKRLGAPADVTGPALFLLSPAAGFVTGHTLPVDGGYALA
ncbi:SDR family oxidoreductase [Occultella glacieicola]|uniref:SDR family oxidoreductase n=1 Tax=Occultella glacieicola TaxID=2518684 RepID=A0ABY2E510_9MICO|nr:SDR family oxidoreductase [Occultella glacieicola]TDE94981.1 SDR family oxidoreductase [Occultella glacieicola]